MTAVAVHHEVRGPDGAPPVVLAGALGTTLALWDAQVGALSRTLRVVRYDHRGHGRSPVPPGPYAIADLGADVLALLDRLELARVSFCGLSIGGMVGLWLAVHAPERLDRLILCATTAYAGPPASWHERAALVRGAGSVAPLADTIVERWLTPAFAEEHPAARARLHAMLVATPPEGYAGCCEAVAGHDERGGLGAITTPTLVVVGAQDASVAAEQGRALAGAIDGARLTVLDPAAHILAVQCPGAVTDLILDHVASAEA